MQKETKDKNESIHFKFNASIKRFLILLLSFINFCAHASNDPREEKLTAKSLETNMVEGLQPKIDGNLNDMFWESVEEERKNFVQFQPVNGEESQQESIIKIAYTDYGIYVSALLLDQSKLGIRKELGIRDDDSRNTDQFGIIIDTYNNGQNAFYFKVSAAGVQTDIFINRGDSDYNWGAVWKSAVEINDNGWQVEMEIPYAAIRFPKIPDQEWGINFMRKIQSINEISYWSYVDNSISGLVNQSGLLTGLKDIKPPLRLSVSPYVTAYYNQTTNGADFNLTGGMDIKYGLTESFTLDMTLIPDFGQVVSDNLVYNLGPFEVQYAENRGFFTEGIELFNRGGLFYSRRIGQSFGKVNLMEGDSLLSQPLEAPLLNASKITGRTKNGTGLGFFNSITNRTFAEIYDKETGEIRKEQVDDLTNFNVMVIDQSLKNNNNISFMNTNVQRLDGGKDANVTSTDFALLDRTNTYRISGFGAYNYISDDSGKLSDGYKYSAEIAKISGKYQFEVGRNVESDTYNPNDLGFLQNSNEVSHYVGAGYNEFQPTGTFNRFNFWSGANYSRLYKPDVYQSFSMWNQFWAETRGFHSFSINTNFKPVQNFDYFEARVPGARFMRTASFNTSVNYASDSRKSFMSRVNFGVWSSSARNQYDYWVGISPRYRVSDQLSINYSMSLNRQFNSIGFAEHIVNDVTEQEQVIFGERDIDVLSNVLGMNFTINNKMGFNFRLRHYWNKVNYFNYFNLETDGDIKNIGYSAKESLVDPYEKHDTNYNAFNIDAVYSWQIAPGSFINVVWKDAVQDINQQVDLDFSKNLKNVLSADHQQNLSVRLIYFLDYTQVKRNLTLNQG